MDSILDFFRAASPWYVFRHCTRRGAMEGFSVNVDLPLEVLDKAQIRSFIWKHYQRVQ